MLFARSNLKFSLLSVVLLWSTTLNSLSVYATELSFDEQIAAFERLLVLEDFQSVENLDKELQVSKKTDEAELPILHRFYRVIGGSNFDTEEEWSQRRQLLEKWRRQSRNSTVPTLALAYHLYRYGWWIRGHGDSNSTLEQKRARFHQELDKSLELVASISETSAQHPAYWEIVLYLGVAKPTPSLQFDAIYALAVLQRPDYLPYHATKAQYLQRRWHGSHKAFRNFVDDTAEKFSLNFGNRLLGRLEYWTRNSKMFSSGRSDWLKTKRSYEEIVASNPVPTNLFQFAKLACIAEDWRTVSQNLVAAERHPTEQDWPADHYKFCSEKARIYGGALTVGEMKQDASVRWASSKPEPEKGEDAQAEINTALLQNELSDDEILAELVDDNTPYRLLVERALAIAKRNPKVIQLLDKHSLVLTEDDLARVLWQVAQSDPQEAINHLDKFRTKRYIVISNITKSYERSLGDDYPEWLAKYPPLWTETDIPKLRLTVDEVFAQLPNIGGSDVFAFYRGAIDAFFLTDEEKLMTYINLHDPDHTKGHFQQVIQRWSKHDPAQALLFIHRYEKPPDFWFLIRFSSLMKKGIDPVNIIKANKIDLPRDYWARLIISTAVQDTNRALEMLESYPDLREQVFSKVKRNLRERYKEDFPEWLLLNPAWITPGDIVLLVRGHRQELIAYLESLPTSSRKNRLVESLERIVPDGMPYEALSLMPIPDSRLQEIQVSNFNTIIRRDLANAQLWGTDNPDKMTQLAILLIADASIQKKLISTFEWLQRFEVTSKTRSQYTKAFRLLVQEDAEKSASLYTEELQKSMPWLMFTLVDNWWARDAEAVEKWVLELKPGQPRDDGLRFLGDQYGMYKRDYKTALRFYNEVSDQRAANDSKFNLLPLLYRKDKALFDKIALEVDLNEEALKQVILHSEKIP